MSRALTSAQRDAAREVGFGAAIQRNGRTVHVQTEVFGEHELRFRSSVIVEGAVLSSVSELLPQDLPDLDALRVWVERRHRQVVEQATQGDFD